MAKKKTSKKKVAKKTKAAMPTPKIASASKPRTKGEVYRTLAEQSGVTRGQVSRMFEVMSAMIEKDLGRSGPGVFNVPGMMKVMVQRKPATKARKGINPFTGEETMFKAKPARNVVKVRPLKGLKELV
ncbi:MAG: DNA-binding protein [Phycisphaerales bacterium]|nr:MAG: DNA-binding protein [Phycisphaerales bacterium]